MERSEAYALLGGTDMVLLPFVGKTLRVAATFRTSEIRLGGSLFVCMSVGASCKPTLPFFSLREILGKEKISFLFSPYLLYVCFAGWHPAFSFLRF